MEYSIGDFSRISRLGIKTLRYYHEIQLLAPARIDPLTGYRYYDERCLHRALAIARLKELDFSLADIHELLAETDNDPDLVAALQKKLAEVDQKIAGYRQVRERIERFLNSETAALAPAGEVSLKDVPDLRVVAVRFLGSPVEIGVRGGALCEAFAPEIAGNPFALYYDENFIEEMANIEVCLPVARPIDRNGVRDRVLPGGRMAVVIHAGPYTQLWRSYQVMVDYFNRENLRCPGPTREIYLRGPGTILPTDPSQFITEIQFPIAQ